MLSKFSLISGAHESHLLPILSLLTRVVEHLLSFVFNYFLNSIFGAPGWLSA